MKRPMIVFLIIVAAAAVYVAANAIVESTDVTRGAATYCADPTAPSEEASSELGDLLEHVSTSVLAEGDEGIERDPMVPYKAPVKKQTTSQASAPPPPSIRVLALILDESPRAVVRYGGANLAVRVGDSIGDARVTEIEGDGIRVEDSQGVHNYPYPPRR